MLEPEPSRYTVVSELQGTGSIWTNPAALGFQPGEGIQALGLLAFGPNPGADDLGLRQALLGARTGPLALGLRSDRFRLTPDDDVSQDGTAFTIALGWGSDRFGFGVSNDQYRRGITSSRWELGGLWRTTNRLTLAASWRDIGSPVVISQRRPAAFLAGGTYRLPGDLGSASAEALVQNSSLERWRGVFRLNLPAGLDALALLDLDSGANVDRVAIGLGYRFDDFRGLSKAGRLANRPGGNASDVTVGASAEF